MGLCLGHAACSQAEPEEFYNHGVAAPVGQAGWGGIHAVINAKGERQILVKLWTGSNPVERRLLRVGVDTGKSEILVPDDGAQGSGGFSTFLSLRNRFYDTVGKRGYVAFYEYDVGSGEWLVQKKIESDGDHGYAMSFTETDEGVIYMGALNSQGGRLYGYDPDSQEIRDHGPLLEGTDWLVYPHLTSDDQGWVYAAIRHKEARIVAFHPVHGKRELLPEEKWVTVKNVRPYRSRNGKAYVRFDQDQWYELYEGVLVEVESGAGDAVLTSSGWKDDREFGDGSRIESISVPDRQATIREKDGKPRTLLFEYDSAGRSIYSLEAGQDGMLYGATGIPLRFFRYNPETGDKADWGLANYGGHINDMVAVGHDIYGAIYSNGALIRMDTRKAWENKPLGRGGNPSQLNPGNADLYGRPFILHEHSGGEHLLLGGNPARARSGGGMLIYSIREGTSVEYSAEQLVPGQGISSLVSLKEGTVVGGSTVQVVTGGVASATQPELFLFDWKERRVVQRVVFEEAFSRVMDMISPDGKSVYGILSGDTTILFYFDSSDVEQIHSIPLSEYGRPAGSQAERILSVGPDGNLYILFRDKILRLGVQDHRIEIVAQSPVTIGTGSAWIGDRLFFSSGSEIWSWRLRNN